MDNTKYIKSEQVDNILVDMETLALYEDATPAIKNIRRLLDSIPAADVRPVVLCKNCLYAPSGTSDGEDQGFALEWPHDEWPESNPCPWKCEDGWYSHKPRPDFFCANGKREEQ